MVKMNGTTLKQCISWVKTTMETKNDKYYTIYEWNMLLTILQHLERLEGLEKENRVKDGMIKFFETEYKKLEKVLEILKTKKVVVGLLLYETKTLEQYNKYFKQHCKLTLEEYELLKEVLGE